VRVTSIANSSPTVRSVGASTETERRRRRTAGHTLLTTRRATDMPAAADSSSVLPDRASIGNSRNRSSISPELAPVIIRVDRSSTPFMAGARRPGR
jgi:hypothetical protein